jgi:hypothetical protein
MIIEVWLHAFVTSALDGGQWPHSTFNRFTLVPITQKAWWAPEPSGTFWRDVDALQKSEARFLGHSVT